MMLATFKMVRSAFFVTFLLLCGLAATAQQARMRTGTSSNNAQNNTTTAPKNTVNPAQLPQTIGAPPGNNTQPKPNPAVATTPAVAPQPQPVQQVQPPLRPEQMPPVPPKVVYQNGLLSVEATNSTLSDVLNGIRTKAGIQIEGIQGAQDRVAAKLGPAPAQVVLTNLLQGSHFDYMILARPDRPNIVQRVILTPASGSGLSSNASNGVQPRHAMVLNQGDPDSDEAEEANVPQPAPQIQQLPPQPLQPQPAQQAGTAVQGNSPKTPEQVLEELKQLQQQQQQNQQNPQQIAPLKPRIPQ